MAGLKNYIMNLDLFGKELLFEEKESSKYHTKTGLLATILLVITCIVIGNLFGKELYLKQNPNVNSGWELVDNSIIKTDDLPIYFNFGDNVGNIKDIEKILTVEYWVLDHDKDFNMQFLNFTDEFKLCNPSSFNSADNRERMEEVVQSSKISGWDAYCINSPKTWFKNSYATRNSSFIHLVFKICNNKEKQCHPDIEKKTQEIYIQVNFLNSYVDPKNFTHPITLFFDSITQLTGGNLMKRIFMSHPLLEKIYKKKEEEPGSLGSVITQ